MPNPNELAAWLPSHWTARSSVTLLAGRGEAAIVHVATASSYQPQSRVCKSGSRPSRVHSSGKQLQLLGPGEERCRRLLPLAVSLRALELMQHLVSDVDAGAALVLTQQRDRVRERADGSSIAQMKLGLDAKMSGVQHGSITGSRHRGSATD